MDGLLRFKIMALRTAGHFTVFWVFGVIGFFILIYKQRQKGRLFILLFFLFSFLSLSAGFYFREHYFVLMIPAISITAAYFTELLSSALAMKPWGKMLPIVVLLMGMLFTFTVQGKLYFKLPPDEVSREVYGLNPFVESIKIAQYLKGHAQKGDMIAILGSEPQILFYSGIRSVTGYIYMYGLMEDQPFNLQMQHGMTDEIEKNKPAFIVFVKIPASWLPAPNAPLYIFDWATNYIAENYNLVGVVDLIYYDNIVYKFDAEALNYNPWSKYYVCIYRRKDG